MNRNGFKTLCIIYYMKKKKVDIGEFEEKIIYVTKIILGVLLIVVGVAGVFIPLFPDIILILAGLILIGNKTAKKLSVKIIRKIRNLFK